MDYEEEAGPARQSHSPRNAFANNRRRANASKASVYTGSAGDPYFRGLPAMNMPRQQAAPQPQAGPPAAAPAPNVPAMPLGGGNSLGWSPGFQGSVSRDRAMGKFKTGTYATLREKGEGERAAAQRAFAATDLAGADFDTGNFFLGRGLAMDANARENQTADAAAYETGAHGNLMNEQAYTGIPASAAFDFARANVGVPAAAALDRAQAHGVTEQANTTAAMRPGQVAGQDFQLEQGRAMLPYQMMGAATQIGQGVANVDATRAGIPAMQSHNQNLQKRNQFLEGQFSRMMGQGLYDPSTAGGATAAGAPAPAPAAPAAAPGGAIPVGTTATNKQTGQKARYNGTTWVPL